MLLRMWRLKQSMQGPWLIWGFKFDRQCPLPLLTQRFLLLTTILQTFTRIDPPISAADPDARFDFFTKAVLPSLPRNTFTSISTFIPRYLTSSECGTTSTTPLSPSVPSRKKHPSPSPTHSHLSSPGRHLSSLAVTRFFFAVGERITSAATTSAQSQGWYSAPCRITYFSTARSRVPLLGGALARGRLRRSRRWVWYSPMKCYKLARFAGSKRVRVMCADKG